MIATIGTALRFTTGERSTAEPIWRRTLVVQTGARTCGYDARSRGISSSVERQLPKLERWVRFPYPASLAGLRATPAKRRGVVDQTPFRVRFRVILTVVPPVSGVVVGALLWGRDAEPEFFASATHVLAIGAVGMALTGHFFRLAIHRGTGAGGVYAIFNVLTVLLFTGLGLFFAFRALANGQASAADVAFVGGSLTSGIAAFGVQALFGTPGVADEE